MTTDNPTTIAEMIIFPLPGAAMFPGTLLPLHIFEPRYREMTNYALVNQCPIAVAMIDERSPATPFGPAVKETVGIGEIVDHEALPDGRFLIVLKGTQRATIVREHTSGQSYRTVAVEVLEDEPVDAQKYAAISSVIDGLIVGFRSINTEFAQHLDDERKADEGFFAYKIASSILNGGDEKDAMLRENVPEKRLSMIVDRLAEILARAASPEGPAN